MGLGFGWLVGIGVGVGCWMLDQFEFRKDFLGNVKLFM